MRSVLIDFDAETFNTETGFTGDTDDPAEMIEDLILYYKRMLKIKKPEELRFFVNDMVSFINNVEVAE